MTYDVRADESDGNDVVASKQSQRHEMQKRGTDGMTSELIRVMGMRFWQASGANATS